MNPMGSDSQQQPQQQQQQQQQQLQYAQPFVAQQGTQQIQYVPQGSQQLVLTQPPQGSVQGGQGQQYVVMVPPNQQEQSGTGALAQAFGGLGVQSEQKRVHRGVVKRWNLEKGYGFIQPVEGGEDVFVHHSVIHAQGFKSLMEGSEVEYESVQVSPGRIRAQRVTGPNGTFAKGAPRPPNPPMISTTGQMQVVQLITLPNGQTAAAPVQQQGQQGQQFYTYSAPEMGGGQGGGSNRQQQEFSQVPVQSSQSVQGQPQHVHFQSVQGGSQGNGGGGMAAQFGPIGGEAQSQQQQSQLNRDSWQTMVPVSDNQPQRD